MKSTESIQPIWRVKYRDDEGNLQSASVSFKYKEDAQDFCRFIWLHWLLLPYM